MEEVVLQLKKVKEASSTLLALSANERKAVLLRLAELLQQRATQLVIVNRKDCNLMAKTDPKYDRLVLTEQQVISLAEDVKKVAELPDTLGNVLAERVMPNGLKIQKIAVPIGVVAVVYESRPNVTVDVFALCFKAGNACVLKGGKEAKHSNEFILSLIDQVLKEQGINPHVVYLLPSERAALQVILHATELIDVCIPRGSQSLINAVREEAKIPVIETGAGIVHTYFDVSGDVQKAKLIIHNAKTRKVSVCNALDTLIIHKQCLSSLPLLVELLAERKVVLYADEPSYKILHKAYPEDLLKHAKSTDFGMEFLSLKLSIKTADSIEEACRHIKQYGSGHSEAIITEDAESTTYFLATVDAAAVYVNASTAFTDGGQFGMGAEIGISTQKLHARGPMGLEALTSYKWVIYGDGQVRE